MAEVEVEVEAPAVTASGGLSSPLSGSIVLLTGFGLKVTVRDGLRRPTSAAGRSGALSSVDMALGAEFVQYDREGALVHWVGGRRTVERDLVVMVQCGGLPTSNHQ